MLDTIYNSPTTVMRETIAKAPSAYFASNVFVGASFMSSGEAAMRYEIGLDRIMWGADYPHIEGSWPYTRESLRKTFAGVPPHELRAMLGANAARCYTLDLGGLRDI